MGLEYKETKRITVSLDEDTEKMLEELADAEKRSISEIVRFAISDYYKKKNIRSVDPEYIDIIVDLLSEREHVILDVGLWTAILEELNATAKDEFWKFVAKVGREYGIVLKVKGLKSIYDVLKYLEPLNWFRVKIASQNMYILVLTVKAEIRVLSVFLQSLFEAMEVPAEVIEGVRKLIVIEKDFDNSSEILRRYLD